MIAALPRRARAGWRQRVGLGSVRVQDRGLVVLGAVIRPLAGRFAPTAVRSLDDEALGRRVVLASVGAMFGARMLPGTPLGKPLLGALGALVLAARLEARDRDHSPEAILAMPDVLDRIAMCVLAGRSVEHALRLVALDVDGPLSGSLRAAVATLDAGGARREAFDVLVRGPAGEAWAAPVAAMERAERLGVPVAEVLVNQARELRHHARTIVEAQVRAAPIKLVFPLVFCFLPAFLVLAIGPVAVSALRTLTAL